MDQDSWRVKVVPKKICFNGPRLNWIYSQSDPPSYRGDRKKRLCQLHVSKSPGDFKCEPKNNNHPEYEWIILSACLWAAGHFCLPADGWFFRKPAIIWTRLPDSSSPFSRTVPWQLRQPLHEKTYSNYASSVSLLFHQWNIRILRLVLKEQECSVRAQKFPSGSQAGRKNNLLALFWKRKNH